jgi:hypothetical protein
MDFAWTAVKETSKNSEDSIIKDALSRATNDDAIKKKLMQFVSQIFIR